MEVLPLTRNGFKVLSCIGAKLDDANRISKIVKLDKDSVKLVLTALCEQKYVTTSGLFAFMERKITAEGNHVLSVYSQVFGRDEDVIDVVRQLQVG
jgi:DNA-binding IclR family transcriptional regulator